MNAWTKIRMIYSKVVEVCYFNTMTQQIAKFDIVERKHVEWVQKDCYPSEPVFVASPGAVEEDDGESYAVKHTNLYI